MSVRKRIRNKICAKSTLSTLLSILFTVNTVLTVASMQFLLHINSDGFYEDSGRALKNSITEEMMEKSGHDALMYFHHHLLNLNSVKTESAYLSAYKDMFSEEKSNFFFSFTDTGKIETLVVFSNYTAESGKDYYPDSKDFFNSVENITLIRSTDTLNFEGHIRKDMTADDAYSRLDKLFGFINGIKYIWAVMTVILVMAELVMGYFLCSCAGYKNGFGKLTEGEIDRIPSYILTIFFVPAFVFGSYFLNKKFSQLCNWMDYAQNPDISADLYTVVLMWILLALCLKTLLTTISVRIKSPSWWKSSWVYKLVGLRKNIQAVTGFVIAALICETGVFMLSGIFGGGKYKWIAVITEAVLTVMVCYIIMFVERNVSVWTKETHRIAINGKGRIPLQDLSGSHLDHAENINFLSRSASAETEKRFINESFSTKLINGISNSIKSPLSQVLELVDELNKDDIDDLAQNECIGEINRLSVKLKKTIEDIILISKATAGNLEINPDYTDLGVFLSQVIGEYYGLFAEKNIGIAEKRDNNPVIVNADGQYLWYAFSGVFSVIYGNALCGSRLHIGLKRVGDRAVVVFRANADPENGEGAFLSEGDLSLPTAKVFAELQGGDVHFSCKNDIMTVVLRFPLARIGETKKVVSV